MIELGLGAADALSVPGTGWVIGTYRRAAYLDVPGGLFALTAPDVPMGPVHARADAPLERLRVGDRVVVTPTHLQAGPLLFDRRDARRWRGPVPSPAALDNGAPLAIMDGTYVTAIRTGGTAAVAARALARKDAVVLAILGAGVQGESHLATFPRVRDFREIRVDRREA